MADLMTPQDLLKGIENLISVNPLFTGKDLNLFVIANEKAGGFTQTKESEKNQVSLDKVLKQVEGKETVTASITSELVGTERAGHGEELAAKIAAGVQPEKNRLTVIVAAGGDGTSLEVQTGLTKWANESESNKKIVQNDIVIFRLPLGTGNDGTDGHTFEESLNVLTMSLHFANARAIKLSVSGEVTEEGIKEAGKNPADYGNVEVKAPWYSFNVAGIGLDAFVCWKTNEEKAKHPGNHYSIMVDFATLNYNKAFPPEDAEIKIYDGDELKETLNTAFEMLTFGVSGHRTFGGGKQIFPVDDNVACVCKLDVMTMVMQNKKFNDGSYIKTELAKTCKATKLVVNYDHPVLCELDGETHLLMKENFPVTLELTEPCIQVLERDDLEWSRGAERK